MKKILVIGAASTIAFATEKLMAQKGARFFLTDLKKERLEAISLDLNARFKAESAICEFDVTDYNSHEKIFNSAIEFLGDIDIVLIAHGTLPKQELMQTDHMAAVREFNVNALSVISLSTIVLNYFEQRNSGTLCVISSVAGDRGRMSNYLYGSAKGAVSLFLQGARNRLSATNVKVITIKPGMVDTAMTADMPKNFLFAKPEAVAAGILNAIIRGKDIAYVPGFWRLVMFIIKHIPESIFKKLKL